MYFNGRRRETEASRETASVRVKTEYQDDNFVSPALLWEMIELKIRAKSMEYAKAKKEKRLRKEEELKKKINALQKDIENRNRGDNETITTQR